MNFEKLENCDEDGYLKKLNKKYDERIRKLRLYYTTRLDSIKKFLREYHYDKLLENDDWVELYLPVEQITEIKGYIRNRGKVRFRFAMFTINYKSDSKLEEIFKKVNKCVKKKWIIKYAYCYETRGLENNEFKGIHTHMLVELKENKKCYECVREVRNTFKNLIGNPLHVNVRYNNNYEKFYKYIKGFKKNELKENNEIDKLFRQRYNLKDVYENKIVLT